MIFKKQSKLGVKLVNALMILMVVTSACNLPSGNSNQSKPTVNLDDQDLQEEQGEAPEIVDPNLQSYRIFFDGKATEDENVLQIKYFIGQLKIANLEEIFGDLDELPLDDGGNRLGGPVLAEGLLWTLMASPSLDTLNVVTQGANGLINSAFDLDGDGTADIVDMRNSDGKRFSFVTEGIGMQFFEEMLKGNDPWCNPEIGEASPLGEGFGCNNNNSGGSSGGAGFPSSGGLIDPFAMMCSEYETSGANLLSRVVTHADGTEVVRKEYSGTTTYSTTRREYVTEATTVIYENLAGEHTRTVRVFREVELLVSGEAPTSENTRLVSFVVEVVNSNGEGRRTISRYSMFHVSRFSANLDPEGDYVSEEMAPPYTGDPPPDEGDGTEGTEGTDEEIEAVVPVEVPVTEGDPGPEGNDMRMADLCNRIGTKSGIEKAAETDPGTFMLRCSDLTGAPSNSEDCVIIDWANQGDLFDALNVTPEEGCNTFEQDTDHGECEPTTAMKRLKGLTAAVAAANFADVDICTGFSCRDFDSTITIGVIEEVSDTEPDFAEDDFATAIPNADPSAVAVRNASCRKGADAAFDVVNFLYKEQSAFLLGRILEDTWYYLELPDNLGNCWVFAENLTLEGPVDQLPYLIPPALPNPVNNGGGDTTSPVEASNLSYVCKPGFFEFTLSWNDNSDNEDGFNIFKDGGQVGSVGENVTNFTFNPGGSNVSTYIVEAYNSNGYSHSFIYGVACLP